MRAVRFLAFFSLISAVAFAAGQETLGPKTATASAPATPPAPAPAPARDPNLPPSEEQAKAALEKSPRHGEWADVKLPTGGTPIRTWVVYPERKDKASVVLVIHEVYRLSDWIRAVADQR